MRFLFLSFLCCLSLVGRAQAADITQVNPKALEQQGISAYQRGDYQNALRYLHARARLNPADANVYYYMGNCYLHTKQNENAARMYSACIRSGPGSEASKHALTALESLSTMPKTAEQPEVKPEVFDAKAAEASRDSLHNASAVDKSFNDAVARIRSQRQTFKAKVDHIWHRLEEDLLSMSPKSTPNYLVELERVRRESDSKVEFEQLKQLRWESRMMAPDKIDARAVPDVPEEKKDDAKTALGSLSELFKPEKPFDPFGPEVNAELTAKFLNMKDVFGELATYQQSERRAAKQQFMQLKNSIEVKQDSLDQQIHQAKDNLIRDLVQIKITYNVSGNPNYNQASNPTYHMASSKIPRADQSNSTPEEQEISKATERTKKRLAEIKESYLRDVDALIAAAKERVGGMVAQAGQRKSQRKRPGGTIQIVPQGSDSYTRNYVNFGHSELPTASRQQPVQALKADPAKVLPVKHQQPAANAGVK